MAFDSPITDLAGDTEILNWPDGFGAGFARRGASSRGKQRTTIEIRAEVLLHDFSYENLGAGPAQAIQDAIKRGIAGITELASPATLRRRQVARRAFDRGESWAMKRYSGGRTGPLAPAQSVRLFSDSGRLREGIFVRHNVQDQSFSINCTANRLDPSEFSGGTFDAMLNRLRSLVPVLGDSRSLLADDTVRAAINESVRGLITKANDANAAKLKSLAAARRRVVLQIVRMFV